MIRAVAGARAPQKPAALEIMSLTWMSVIAVLVIVQKFVPVRAAIDVPIALAMIGFGILIVTAPAAVPGLAPST